MGCCKKGHYWSVKVYEEIKNDYSWKKRVDVDIVSSPDKKITEQTQIFLREGKSVEDIKKELNTKEKINIIVTSGIYEIGQSELPENFNVKMGVSELYNRDAPSVVVNVKGILPTRIKEFDEVKGLVISKYQIKIRLVRAHKKKFAIATSPITQNKYWKVLPKDFEQ